MKLLNLIIIVLIALILFCAFVAGMNFQKRISQPAPANPVPAVYSLEYRKPVVAQEQPSFTF